MIICAMDLGSERIMGRQLENYGINILQLHAEWLVANGYKRQAASCKRQASSLTRQEYRIIREYEKDKKQTQ